jgi:epoxyqueuosine reductase
MEKPLAQAAGLGWQGKHTVLVSRERQLAVPRAIFTTRTWRRCAETDHCGSCRAASTSARPTPSPRPTSSMRGAASPTSRSSTRGPIDRDLRELIGNRIFGCDDCLAVCPWNKFAQTGASEAAPARGSRRAARSPTSPASTMPPSARVRGHARSSARARPLRAQRADRHRQLGIWRFPARRARREA